MSNIVCKFFQGCLLPRIIEMLNHRMLRYPVSRFSVPGITPHAAQTRDQTINDKL